jgi:Zn-dependent protease
MPPYNAATMIKALLFLFKSKAALTAGTMLLSVFAYALLWGWPYAAGFVLLIFLHEMGHFVAARQRGLNVGAPTFIPFVGAWIQLKDMPHNAETEAYVGIAGPVAGTAAALACFALSRVLDNHLLLALAYAGFMLNLFNLLPLSPLDGGRVTAVISPRLWLLGGPILVALFLWNPSPMFLLIALLAFPSFWQALRGQHLQSEYYLASPNTRAGYTLAYLGLIAYLGVMTYSVHQELSALTGAR